MDWETAKHPVRHIDLWTVEGAERRLEAERQDWWDALRGDGERWYETDGGEVPQRRLMPDDIRTYEGWTI